MVQTQVPGQAATQGDLLNAAKARMHGFVLERLGEAGPLLRAHFGWQHTNATAFRTGTRGKSLALTKMTPEMLAKLRNQTRLDHQLYDYACMLFDQQTELLAKSPSGGGGGLVGDLGMAVWLRGHFPPASSQSRSSLCLQP